jgi:DNA-binding NarL/FixJ family response regulator
MFQIPLNVAQMAALTSTPKIPVLIVERHAAVRRALNKRLSATSHLDVIASVNEPAAAIPFLESKQLVEGSNANPTVVLLGLQNGTDEELFKTLDIVQQMSNYRATVVVLAPYADEIERLLLQQAGASHYLLKHIDSIRLIQEIESAAHYTQSQVIGRQS